MVRTHARRTGRFAIACALACVGCGSPPQREPDEYLGCATDENWRTFDEKEVGGLVKSDDAQAPAWKPPIMEGASLPGSPPPTLTWDLTPSLPGKPTGNAACMKCPSCGALVAAHEAPVSGDVFDLQFSVGGTMAYRVLTTMQSYAPSDAAWANLRGKSVSLRAVRMTLKVNDVTDGPFQAAKPIAFTVGS